MTKPLDLNQKYRWVIEILSTYFYDCTVWSREFDWGRSNKGIILGFAISNNGPWDQEKRHAWMLEGRKLISTETIPLERPYYDEDIEEWIYEETRRRYGRFALSGFSPKEQMKQVRRMIDELSYMGF